MSPALCRLKRRPQFLRTAAAGLKWVTPGVIVQARKRDGSNGDLPADTSVGVGFTVSKKVGNAVRRNRAKRRLRAAAEQVLSTAGRGGMDYVLIGRKATIERPFGDLVADLAEAVGGIDKKASRAARETVAKQAGVVETPQ